jgi:hypothetical protein
MRSIDRQLKELGTRHLFPSFQVWANERIYGSSFSISASPPWLTGREAENFQGFRLPIPGASVCRIADSTGE